MDQVQAQSFGSMINDLKIENEILKGKNIYLEKEIEKLSDKLDTSKTEKIRLEIQLESANKEIKSLQEKLQKNTNSSISSSPVTVTDTLVRPVSIQSTIANASQPYSSFQPPIAVTTQSFVPTSVANPYGFTNPINNGIQPYFTKQPITPTPVPTLTREPAPAPAPTPAPTPAQPQPLPLPPPQQSLLGGPNARPELLQFLRIQKRPLPPANGSANPKADLANWCGQVGLTPPVYQGEKEGPDHYPTFVVRAYLRGVEIGVGRGMRKTQAEVETAIMALQNLDKWTTYLNYEGDKYFRINTAISSDINVDKLAIINGIDEYDLNESMNKVLAQCNAFVNTAGGVIMFGIDNINHTYYGFHISYDDVRRFVDMFVSEVNKWTPALDNTLYKVRVWPVFDGKVIDNGEHFEILHTMFSQARTNGMSWDSDQRVVLSITVFQSDTFHKVPLDQLIEDKPENINENNAMYIQSRNGIRLVPSESMES